MNECPTCRHIKPDGTYCGSPSQRDRKYCYYHLTDRGRRLRRARALRDNIPYRLEIPLLDSPSAVRFAITEIIQALGAGQLDHRVAGKMLYGIQMANSLNRRTAHAEAKAAAASANQQEQTAPDPNLRVQEYPQFEQEFGINPGADVDAEINWTLHQAEEREELRQPHDLPMPPAGLRPGSARYQVYREEAYQALNKQLNGMRHQLRDYYEMKRKESEKQVEQMRKEAISAAPPTACLANSA